MRARPSDRRKSGVRLLACSAVALLVASCSGGDPAQVEASQASPEPTIQPQATAEPTEEPSEPEPEPEPTIGDDEPLYAPLPELTPDPDNDIPDDIEQLILDAFAEAYENEMSMYAAAAVDEDALRATHFGEGYNSVLRAVEYIVGEAGRELTPDATVTSVDVVDFDGGSAVLRECVEFGPRSGLYAASDMQMLKPVVSDRLARDRLVELAQWTGDQEASYRVTQIGFAAPEECAS